MPDRSGDVSATAGAVSILLVEDEPSCRYATALLLRHLGFRVETVASSLEALDSFDGRRHQLVITDEFMPGLSGRDLAEGVKQKSPGTPVVMYRISVDLPLQGVDAAISKPGSIEEFRDTLERITGKALRKDDSADEG